jgi:hypothetical protein
MCIPDYISGCPITKIKISEDGSEFLPAGKVQLYDKTYVSWEVGGDSPVGQLGITEYSKCIQD